MIWKWTHSIDWDGHIALVKYLNHFFDEEIIKTNISQRNWRNDIEINSFLFLLSSILLFDWLKSTNDTNLTFDRVRFSVLYSRENLLTIENVLKTLMRKKKKLVSYFSWRIDNEDQNYFHSFSVGIWFISCLVLKMSASSFFFDVPRRKKN